MKEIYLLLGLIDYESITILGAYTSKEKALKQLSIAKVNKDIKDKYNQISIKLVEINKTIKS